MAYNPQPEDFEVSASPKTGYTPAPEDFENIGKSENTKTSWGDNAKGKIKEALNKKYSAQDFFNSIANKSKNLAQGAVALPINLLKTSFGKNSDIDAMKGAAQEIGNYPAKLWNLIPGNNASLMDIAPKTEGGERGKVIGDVASYFMPGKGAALGLNALSKIPKIGKGINAVKDLAEAKPIIKNAAQIGGAGVNAGLYNAANHPESKVNQFKNGLALGSGGQALINFMTSKNPIIRAIGSIGSGALIGHTLGHPAYGALFGSVYPEIKNALVTSGNDKIAKKALEGIQPADVEKSVAANKLLKTPITPGQAAGNEVTGAAEGRLAGTPASARVMREEKLKQKEAQQEAIKRTLDSIYEPTEENDKKITAAYDKANLMNVTEKHTRKIDPQVIDELSKNKYVHDAFEDLRKRNDMQNIPTNNFKFLTEVKKHLDVDYKDLKKQNKTNEMISLGKVKDMYNKFLKDINPDYEKALKLAQPRIVRRNIQMKFNKNKEDQTGKNFYNRFFNTESNTNWLYNEAKDYPNAVADFQAMQEGWRHLSNMKTVGAAAGAAAQKTDQARNEILQIFDHIKHIAGAQNDIKQIQYIHNTNQWSKDINRIAKIKDHSEMLKQAMNLFGRVGLAYGLSPSAKHQLINHKLDLENIDKELNNPENQEE